MIIENKIGGVNQFKPFQARGYPIIMPDKWPKKDDRGMITLVTTSSNKGPTLTGNPEIGPRFQIARGLGM